MTKPVSPFNFTLNPEAAASIHDNGIVILHTGQGRMFASNQTGARIWRGIERQLPLDAIAAEISDEYQIARTTAREDVSRFLAELERQTLIERGTQS